MSELAGPPADSAPTFSRLDVGMLIVLVAMAIAGVVGLIAVLDTDNRAEAVGVGVGVAALIFQSGGTIACALACLARRRMEIVSLVALVAAGLAVDLSALGIWLDPDSEVYGKLVAVAFIGTLFGLLILSLTLACQPRDPLSRAVYFGAVGASLLGAAIAWVLILTTGGDDFESSGELFDPVPVGFSNDALLRPLAATLVIAAALWLAALAASRVERPPQS